MKRPLVIVAALTLASAAAAQAPGAYYVAVPAVQPARTSFIARSTPWALRDGTFVADRAPGRPEIVCELVVKEVGALNSFTAGGTPLDPAQLQKCNARAR